MNRLAAHISKTLAVLVILMLPIQQCLALSCCCRTRPNDSVRTAAHCQADRSSDDPSSCCSTACASDELCSSQRASNADSPPCQCPDGGCDRAAPETFEPGNIESTADVDMSTFSTLRISTTTGGGTTQLSLAGKVGRRPSSALIRCSVLCRYRL